MSRDVATSSTPPPPEVDGEGETEKGFHVHLDVFTGPFDLLLSLIARHELDVTEVALAAVTEEFLAHVKTLGREADLSTTTEFLVVAATLLDLKVARLLPGETVEDEEDLALLEARDLLFARLLQYRAYRAAAEVIDGLWRGEARRHARTAVLEPRFAALVPDVLLGIGPVGLAELAAAALRPRPAPEVAVDHVHAPAVDVAEQGRLLRARLHAGGATFRDLTADCGSAVEVVARFLALLDLYRAGLVAFDQPSPLGDLVVRAVPPPAETPDGPGGGGGPVADPVPAAGGTP